MVMGFPPRLWFAGGGEEAEDMALEAALEDETNRAILEEAARMGARERGLLLGIARQISGPSGPGSGGG